MAVENRELVAAGSPAFSIATSRRAWFVYAFSAFYAATFAVAGAASYLLYLEPRLDLGNMVQTVWSTAHGHFLQMSDPSGTSMSRLGTHVDPFLALLVPLWWIWSNPIVLLAAQAVAVATGALPVYWLARKHLGDGGFAVVFSIAYLLYPCTQFNAFTPIGIHAVSFGIPLILYAIWFLDEQRLIPFTVFAVAAATTKEEIAAAVGGLGIWYAVRHGQKLVGCVIFAVGYAVSAFSLEVVIPHYAAASSSPFAGRYKEVGGTPTGILRTVGTDPSAFVHQMVTWHKLLFLVLVFAPFLGFWALEPIMLIGAVPDLAVNLLSSKPEQTTIFYQYTAGIVPFVVAASILGAARLQRRRRAPTLLLAVITALAIVSPLVYLTIAIHTRSDREISATRAALKFIPPQASVSASETLGAYVSTRKNVAIFPDVSRAEWVLVGRTAVGDPAPERLHATLVELSRSPRWSLLFSSDRIWVFHRKG